MIIKNPVLIKELKLRMRGWRSPLVISFYLGVLALISFAYFYSETQSMARNGYFNPSLGIQIYTILAYFQLFLIAFVTPALTTHSISGERERQTFELLLCTRLSAAQIIWGKLTASISYVVILIIASIPLFSTVFLFGGVSPLDIIKLFLFYLITAFAIGCIGIFCSAIAKRTQVSNILAYAIVFFLFVGTLITGLFIFRLVGEQMAQKGVFYIPKILYLNPLTGLGFVLSYQNGSGLPFFPYVGGMKPPKIEPWLIHLGVDLIYSTLLLTISIYMIKPIKRFSVFSWGKGKTQKHEKIESIAS